MPEIGEWGAGGDRRQSQLPRASPGAGASVWRREFAFPATGHPHGRDGAEPEYRANPVNRCYYCKHELYTQLERAGARRAGCRLILDGNNADDRGDYRPGRPGGARVRGAQPAG